MSKGDHQEIPGGGWRHVPERYWAVRVKLRWPFWMNQAALQPPSGAGMSMPPTVPSKVASRWRWTPVDRVEYVHGPMVESWEQYHPVVVVRSPVTDDVAAQSAEQDAKLPFIVPTSPYRTPSRSSAESKETVMVSPVTFAADMGAYP